MRTRSPSARLAIPTVLAALAWAATLACSQGGASGSEPFSLVSIDAVERMLRDPAIAVVDANPLDVFARAHLPGAKLYGSAPLERLLPADRDAAILFYCASPS